MSDFINHSFGTPSFLNYFLPVGVLQKLAEFYFFFIWSFDCEEAYSIFPEWKKMNRIGSCIQSVFVNIVINFFDIFDIDSYVVNRTGF